MAISTKTKLKFGTIRQLVDVFSIIGALVIAISFKNPIPIREGTVIGMLLFGPMIAWFIPRFTPLVKRLGLNE
jgi:uncharacterized membrane protein YczE